MQSLFFNKANKVFFNNKVSFSKREPEPLAQVLSCEFCEISKNSFSHRTSLVATSARRLKNSNYCWKALHLRCLQGPWVQLCPLPSIKLTFDTYLNPFVPNALFLYPLKTSENLTVF